MPTLNDPNGQPAAVNDEGQLVTHAIIQTELEHASLNGLAYSWDSLELDIDVGDTMLLVKNIGDQLLHLDYMIVNGSNVACVWEFGLGALTDTIVGADVLGVNMNEVFRSASADAEAKSDETGIADATISGRIKTLVNAHHLHRLDGFILGKNHYIQINQKTESTSGSVILVGHYE